MRNKRALFSISPDSEFFDRRALMERIIDLAAGGLHPVPGLILRAGRWTGKTELLRRVHRELFFEQASTLPVYYQFRGRAAAGAFAGDFLREVVRQFVAFMAEDADLAARPLAMPALLEIARRGGFDIAASLLKRHREAERGRDEEAMLKNALDAPRIISVGAATPVFLLLDDFDRSPQVKYHGGRTLAGDLATTLAVSGRPFVVAVTDFPEAEGLLGGAQIETVNMGGLGVEDAVAMMEELLRNYGLDFDSEVLFHAARRLDGNPAYIKNLLWAAKRSGRTGVMADLKAMADLYVREVSSGSIAGALSAVISVRDSRDIRVLKALKDGEAFSGALDVAEALDLAAGTAGRIIRRFVRAGLLHQRPGAVIWAGDRAQADYIDFLYATVVRGLSPEEAATWMARDMLIAGFASRSERMKVDLVGIVSSLLGSFDGARVPVRLLRMKARGAEKGRGTEGEITLPSVTGCFPAGQIEAGPAIVIAHGFQGRRFEARGEVVWITGVKDALMPVNLGDAKNFLRRARILSKRFRAARVVKWMTSLEGFTEEALEVFDREGVFTSDYPALEILRDSIEKRPARAPGPSREYEIILPAEKNSELVAARAAEEIGSEMGFDEESIGRIKASVVEACINAFEHGGTRAARVHLRFVAAPDRLTVYVSNPGKEMEGLRLEGGRTEGTGLPSKRGWGLKLMKGFMDEVKTDAVPGGTRLVMVKYLVKKEGLRGEDDSGNSGG